MPDNAHTHTTNSLRKRNASLILHKKSQSAMEYLMTYGWAILIIAVVLGALFQLGVFNAGTFAPKAPPGACQVYRPNGPASTSLINLEGVCSGELPQYVGQFSQSAEITLPQFSSINSANALFSAAIWLDMTQFPGAYYQILTYGNSGNSGGWYLRTSNAGINYIDLRLHNGGVECGGDAVLLVPNSWNFIAFTFNGVAVTLYGNNNPGLVATCGFTSTTVAPLIGGGFVGALANVQIYNTSLSGPEVNALYLEGIGGAPIKLQNLVGWWPLNGNANDYSGNNNNGVPSGVTYTNQWTTGYTQP